MSKPVLGRHLGYWESGIAARHKYEVVYAKKEAGRLIKGRSAYGVWMGGEIHVQFWGPGWSKMWWIK